MFTWLVLISCEDTTMAWTPVHPRLLFVRCASSCFTWTKMHSDYHRFRVFSLITMQELVHAACYFPTLPAFCWFLFFLVSFSYLLLRLCFLGLVPFSSDTVSYLLRSCPCPSLLHLGSAEAGKFSFPTRKERSKAHACYYPD